VGGNGEGDRLVAQRVAPVAPAWRPGEERLLTYVDGSGRIHLVGTDDHRERWRTGPAQPARGLEWSNDGKWLLAWSPNLIRLYGAGGRLNTAIRVPKRSYAVLAATFKPGTRSIAYAAFGKKTGKSSVFVFKRNSIERFSGVGRFTKLTWSPDRNWLLVSWPSADQWVFLEIPGGVRRIDAVGGIAAEFDPGAVGGAFPLVEGWCCAG
jgi:WD40 repeat protein